MGSYIVWGGSPLEGELQVNGSKNAALPILAAVVLNEGTSVIRNCPEITDVFVARDILKELGFDVTMEDGIITVENRGLTSTEVNAALVGRMRSSIIFMGALLGRFHEAKLAHPGGCAIGVRPIDLHLKALRKMGATITEEGGFLYCKAHKLRGTEIQLDLPSVGATENIILAAVLAEGETVIYNAAREPEILSLIEYLIQAGAQIHGGGTDTIRIVGVQKLHSAEYTVIPDRIEAGTYLVGVALCGGKIFLNHACGNHMRQILLKLEETGCRIQEYSDGILLKAPKKIKPVDIIRTQPYPGFPTDMQPQFMSLLTMAQGTSIIIETVFESRYKHIDELTKMGANIAVSGHTAVVSGVAGLSGAEVYAQDLRAGAALILAGLKAEGKTVVHNSHYVERGYANMEKMISLLGGKIKLVDGE